MSDNQDTDVKVVLRSDVRSVRIAGERELPYFGASGSKDGNLSTRNLRNTDGYTQAEDADEGGAIVCEEAVHELDATIQAQVDDVISDDELSDDGLPVL